MNAERWQQIEEITLETLELPEAERNEFLDKVCSGDTNLRDEVESFLAQHDKSEKFLEREEFERIANSFVEEKESKLLGKRLGIYRIEREIGAGGMGAVFYATRDDGEFEQQVAVKVVRQTIVEKELVNHFRRERQILASLNHPNIAKLLDGGVTETGEPFLVMEYIEGESLIEYSENQNLSEGECLKLFVKICSAVAYAHRNLIVHRDIKPSNILVAKNGEPKLLDFGLAKIVDVSLLNDNQTQTAFRALTPGYASPEQTQGKNVTTASDIYSLGVVLSEMLLHKTGERKSNKKNQPLKHDLRNIVSMALREEPERRYKSVEALAEDIESFLKNKPIKARSATVRYRAGKFIKRNKGGVLAAAFILLAIFVSLIVSLRQAENARRQRDLATAEKLRAERLNRFLQEMLSFSNQSVTSISPVAQTKNVTVNEMLEQIAPQIESELADQPEIHAQILRTVGSSYASQGFYDKAEKNLREALDIQTRIFGEDNVETAATMLELGTLYFRQIKFDDSIRLLEKAVAFYRKQQQENAPEFNPAKLAQALDSLGTTKFYSGDAKSSTAILNEALQIASDTSLQGSELLILASIQTNLGGVLVKSGELDKGESLLRQSLANYNRISANPRWEKGATLIMLGELFNSKNQPDEAEKFILESEQIYRQTLGNKNAYLAYNLYFQSLALTQKKDYNQAVAKMLEAIAIYQDILPAQNPTLTSSTATLGIILTKAGRAREGEVYLRQALSINKQQPIKSFAFIIQNKISLSQCLSAQNRFAEAEKIDVEAVAEARQNVGEQNALTIAAIKELNEVREKQGKGKL